MDKRDVKGVDIAHDIEEFPYPLEDKSCSVVAMRHVMEHIKPWLTLDVMNELWRILDDDGILLIVSPYGNSFGYVQDPTHCNPMNEAWVVYFDPEHPSHYWTIYEPKPWKIEKNYWQLDGNIEIALRKRAEA